MKSEEIRTLFAQFEQASGEFENVECWSARELQLLLGYTQWRNFENTIDKAREACKNAGQAVSYHFAGVSKTIRMPKGAEKEIEDILFRHHPFQRRPSLVPIKHSDVETEIRRSRRSPGRRLFTYGEHENSNV